MQKKGVIIIHCWEESPEYAWYPYAKRELEARGYEVQVPEFPQPLQPLMRLWVPFLTRTIGRPDENLYLVGHSIGAVTILRYLETLQPEQRIGGAVLVAGFTDHMGYYDAFGTFFTQPLKFERIKNSARAFAAIHSDDDPYVDLKYGTVFQRELGAKLIVVPRGRHFSGPLGKPDSCTELPAVVESIVAMTP